MATIETSAILRFKFGGLMHVIYFAASAALAMIAQPALAAPVYLDCSLPDGKGGQSPWTISLNEEASRVTVTHPLATRTLTASFTPDSIIWDGGDFTLDRTSLMLTRRPTFRGKPLGKPDFGQCRISTKKRTI